MDWGSFGGGAVLFFLSDDVAVAFVLSMLLLSLSLCAAGIVPLSLRACSQPLSSGGVASRHERSTVMVVVIYAR